MAHLNQSQITTGARGERGAALVMSMLIVALVAVLSIGVLGVVKHEARVAGGDLQQTQAFYAASAGLEKMTHDFSDLFRHTSKPAKEEMCKIARDAPAELVDEDGFTFKQTLRRNDALLAALKAQNGGKSPLTVIPNGPFSGMFASLEPYYMTTVATHGVTGTQARLEREVNNYMIPLFQFGMFSDNDIELHPGPAFVFNGRVHANGNIYVNGNVKFLDKVTSANELVYDVLRNGSARTGATVSMQVGSINVSLTKSSVNNGPNLSGAVPDGRGYFPDSPSGTDNTSWRTNSVLSAATGVANRFGGQLLTRTTGAKQLLLPLQLDDNPTRELIKRILPNDSEVLGDSRYHKKAEVRILIDDEAGLPAGMPGGIPAGSGVPLSTWVPTRLGNRVLHRFSDTGSDLGGDVLQTNTTGTGTKTADAVRGANSVVNCGTSPVVPAAVCSTSTAAAIPSGAPLSGRILIEIVPPSTTANPEPTPIDVTQTILSMGITEGEPNAIVMLQRPLWAAFTQGSRDGDGGTDFLTNIINTTAWGADGEIKCNASNVPNLNATYGFMTGIQEDDLVRGSRPTACTGTNSVTSTVIPWNNIVPINLYNVREGYINTSLNSNTIYTRGITTVVEINMKNFARWLDGVYDANLLAGTQAVSANINGDDGYILYVSDRRGDRVRSERLGTTAYNMTNGLVDNEDIYGPNNALNPGEDVIDWGKTGAGVDKKGTLQRDLDELPNPTPMPSGTPVTSLSGRVQRAKYLADTYSVTAFRRGVRLINGENLKSSMSGSEKLSETKGISVATENMLYIWGNYNTTGINNVPSGGASLAADYTGAQVPASLVCDAIFPLSKTWFDASPAIYPDDLTKRIADLNLTASLVVTTVPLASESSVRAAVIAGTNMSAMQGTPDAGNGADSRLSGGVHNFPRFLEGWVEEDRRWNYIGSLVPMYYSTQALGPWQYPNTRVIYGAPIRNWAFDSSFTDPNRLPPGTPQFQFVQATGFRETPFNNTVTTDPCS